jgi:hypothetical protein
MCVAERPADQLAVSAVARPTTNIALSLSDGKQKIDWFSKHENGWG